MKHGIQDIKIINYDTIVNQGHYTQPNSPFGIQHPSRVLMSGSSSSGKTNILLNILLNNDLLYYDKIYIYSLSINQPKYQYLIDKIEKVCEENDIDIDEKLFYTSNVDEIKPLESMDKEIQNVIIFDDLLINQVPIMEEIFIRGRHFNITSFFLTQSYFQTNKLIRNNCNVILLWKTNSKNLQIIAQDLSGSMEYDQFVKIFKEAVEEPYSFFMVDRENKNKMLRYRKNFDEVLKAP